MNILVVVLSIVLALHAERLEFRHLLKVFNVLNVSYISVCGRGKSEVWWTLSMSFLTTTDSN